MSYTFEPIRRQHGPAVMGIYNHYIENGFSAYFATPLPEEFFEKFLQMTEGYPALVAIDGDGDVVGFAFLHAYHPAPCLKQTAEITSFLHPDHTHKGLGGQMLETLIEQAPALGVNNIVASISSKNQPSLQFHAKHGFNECGRIVGAGRKFDELFDVVYMQRRIV